jgi:2-methylcitrate dehydratase
LVERLPELKSEELAGLTFTTDPAQLGTTASAGIFDRSAAPAGRSAAAE